MAMQSSLQQFQTAIQVLRQYTITQITSNLQNMDSHLSLVQNAHSDNMRRLRKILIRYKKVQSQMTYQQSNIQTNTVQSWMPVVSSYQNTSVYKTSLTSSVSQIIRAKKDIDMLSNTMSELQIKVSTQGRTARKSADSIDRIQQQIYILQLAIDVNNFFQSNGFNASGIADFEAQKYYDLYMKGVNQ